MNFGANRVRESRSVWSVAFQLCQEARHEMTSSGAGAVEYDRTSTISGHSLLWTISSATTGTRLFNETVFSDSAGQESGENSL